MGSQSKKITSTPVLHAPNTRQSTAVAIQSPAISQDTSIQSSGFAGPHLRVEPARGKSLAYLSCVQREVRHSTPANKPSPGRQQHISINIRGNESDSSRRHRPVQHTLMSRVHSGLRRQCESAQPSDQGAWTRHTGWARAELTTSSAGS